MIIKIKNKFQSIKYLSPIFLFSLAVFFWTLFDSILMYVVPLLMEERGLSISVIGLVIGTSSMSGALFDFFICKFIRNTDFRRIFLLMFFVCALYPFLLLGAETLGLFLIAMAVWGIYFDLYGFGVFNFIGRYAEKEKHASNFGIVQMFRSLGGVLAPIIAGFLVSRSIDFKPFLLSWIFLGFGFIFFIILLSVMKKNKIKNQVKCNKNSRRKNLSIEINLWKKLSKAMGSVLAITFFLAFVESFFWTLAPLYVAEMRVGMFGGLFLTAYIFPALFMGWFVGSLAKRFGKKRTALFGILFGCIVLSFFSFSSNIIISTVVVFLAACFLSTALPAINAAYADYISEAPQVDEEIEGVEDFSFNFGYIFGPISAGILADFMGIPITFTILGLMGVLLVTVVSLIMPKEINIRVNKKEI
ncbi:MAG: MFS transporter [Candidatus Moraniibacteriota bacterium]